MRELITSYSSTHTHTHTYTKISWLPSRPKVTQWEGVGVIHLAFRVSSSVGACSNVRRVIFKGVNARSWGRRSTHDHRFFTVKLWVGLRCEWRIRMCTCIKHGVYFIPWFTHSHMHSLKLMSHSIVEKLKTHRICVCICPNTGAPLVTIGRLVIFSKFPMTIAICWKL